MSPAPAGGRPPRPDFHQYFMGFALAARRRANCKGLKVGAVLVLEKRVVSTGYNGVPEGMTNCLDGGCDRCNQPEKYKSGVGYDICICVHAEMNAVLSAARLGIRTAGSTLYTTVRPCFGCMKALHQAGVRGVYYLHEWKHPDESLLGQYRALENRFPDGVKHLEMEDPDDPAWICPPKPSGPAEP